MNHLALLVSAYLATIGSLHKDLPEFALNRTEWEAYKQQYGKHYEDPQVDLMRSLLFAHKKWKIDQFNQYAEEAKYYTKGLNRFSDLTEQEISSMKGLKLPAGLTDEQFYQNSPEAEQFVQRILEDDSKDVPDELDWRKVPGRVSSVKDQGNCGSCWAFAVIGTLEGQEVPHKNSSLKEAISLSVQNLIDCIDGNEHGCNGGWMSHGFDFIAREGGIETLKDYPYFSIDGYEEECKFDSKKVVIGDKGHYLLRGKDEKKLKELVAKYGPVAVAIDATDHFHDYTSGVLQDPDCYNDRGHSDHGVLIVGYGTDPVGGDYWLVKNSWADDWGDKGYIKMARNKDDQCGIAVAPTIATF